MTVNNIVSFARDGLGGRLICLMNSILLSKYYNSKLSLIWLKNHACHCDFHTIFKPNESLSVFSEIEHYKDDKNITYIQTKIINYYKNTKEVIYDLSDSQRRNENENTPLTRKVLKTCFNQSETIFLTSRRDFSQMLNFPKHDFFNELLQPTDVIQSSINAFIKKHTFNNILGVQVRRGDLVDHKHEKKRIIPVKQYFDSIDAHLVNTSFNKIYLATESEEIIQLFKNKYPTKLLVYPLQKYDRTETGIMHALIDIALLSKCDLIIGGPSGMPDAASILGNVERIKLTL